MSQHSQDLELAPVLRMIASPDTRTRRMRAVAAACIARRPLFVLSLYVRACALRYVASLTLWRCMRAGLSLLHGDDGPRGGAIDAGRGGGGDDDDGVGEGDGVQLLSAGAGRRRSAVRRERVTLRHGRLDCVRAGGVGLCAFTVDGTAAASASVAASTGLAARARACVPAGSVQGSGE
jgi:hypothetical protein